MEFNCITSNLVVIIESKKLRRYFKERLKIEAIDFSKYTPDAFKDFITEQPPHTSDHCYRVSDLLLKIRSYGSSNSIDFILSCTEKRISKNQKTLW